MKKLLLIIILLLLSIPAIASEWFEMSKKTYIHLASIEPNFRDNTVTFWVKYLREDPKEKFPDYYGKLVPYWYIMSRITIDCNNKKVRDGVFVVYNLNGKPIYSNENLGNEGTIIPNTISDGYYKNFCRVPFAENPIFNYQEK